MRDKRSQDYEVSESSRPETPYGENRDTQPVVSAAGSHQQDLRRPSSADQKATDAYGIVYDDGPENDPDAAEQQKKMCAFSLPWWCVIIGWILLFITVTLSVTFVTFYGIQFQDVKCKKWLTSMLISFFTSVLLTQPIKVLLFALFFALVFKKPFEEESQDELEDEEDPSLETDEIYMHGVGGK
jgi:hypothetical protein